MSTKFVKILCNPVVAKLHEPEDEVRYLVSDMLSYLVEGAQFSGKGNWDGYASFYRMRTNSFPAGFVRLVQQKLTLLGYTVTIHKKPAPTPLGPEKPVVDSFPDDTRYDYQPEIAERLISLERMIAQVATGGGKSRIYKICERKLALPSLFLTTRKSLMYQMAENYEASFKMKVGILGDGVWEPRYDGPNFGIVDTISSRLEKVNVEKEIEKEVEKWYQAHEARVQTALKNMNVPDISAMRKPPAELANIVNEVRSRVEKKFPLNKKEITSRVKRKLQSEQDRRPVTLQFLEHIGFLCLEEAHEVSGNGFYAISNACKNAHYRLALTATPFMKDNEEANMRLMAATGPIGYTVSEKLLIERGILAKPYFKYIELPKPARLFKSTAWPKCYKIGIVENSIRNERIVGEAIEAISYGMTVMILVQRKDHGDILKKTLTTMGVKTKFIYEIGRAHV